jgi:hypothetical protein
MPTSRVIPKRLPVSPGQDSRFTIRRNSGQGGVWWVYYKPQGADPLPADQSHPALVERVNWLKETEGNQPGGSFSINEHGQVVARMNAPSGYSQNAIHVVDISAGSVFTYTTTITFQGGALDPSALPAEGNQWSGPLCGATYSFAAPGNRKPPSNNLDEVWIEINGVNVLLSSQISISSYPPVTGALAAFLGALRRQLPPGGAFRVNEHGRAFTANAKTFIGTVPLTHWFRPIPLTD